MSVLKRGTLCIIIAGCPENIGLIVEVIEHLGRHGDREDAYFIKTVSGRNFHQIWDGDDLVRGSSDHCITDRHKLRPLVAGKDDADQEDEVVDRELVVSR